MILLSAHEEERRSAGICVRKDTRGRSSRESGCGAGYYAGNPDRIDHTGDLPFLFEAYGIEPILRAWLERLYVTTFAHGHALRLALREAGPAAIDARIEDYVIEACLIRGWLWPDEYAPREATSIMMGPSPAYWSCWTFKPGSALGDWLEGGGLPVIGDPLRQAEYDGETRGLRFRTLERKADERDLEIAIWDAYLDLQEAAELGNVVPGAVRDGDGDWCIPWMSVLMKLRTSYRWSGLTEEEAVRAQERLEHRGALCDPASPKRGQLGLRGSAE